MKTCNAPGCIYPVWGKGFCRSHQYLRDDKKPKPIPSRSDKKVAIELSFGFDTQTALFAQLWDNAKDQNGDVICPFTREKLNRYRGRDIWWSCFAHVLPKGRFPYFKLNPDNVCVVSPNFHKIVDQGSFDDRKKHPEWEWDAWDARVIEMKEKYAQFKKDNLLP